MTKIIDDPDELTFQVGRSSFVLPPTLSFPCGTFWKGVSAAAALSIFF
jgi:hypothetical protein